MRTQSCWRSSVILGHRMVANEHKTWERQTVVVLLGIRSSRYLILLYSVTLVSVGTERWTKVCRTSRETGPWFLNLALPCCLGCDSTAGATFSHEGTLRTEATDSSETEGAWCVRTSDHTISHSLHMRSCKKALRSYHEGRKWKWKRRLLSGV